MSVFYALLLTACFNNSNKDSGEFLDSGISCTAEQVFALNLTLTDKDGQPLTGAEINYSVDGEQGDVVIEDIDGLYLVGGDVGGLYEVVIYAEVPFENDPLCWDVGEGELSLEVLADECHVIPQSFEPELEWIAVCQ